MMPDAIDMLDRLLADLKNIGGVEACAAVSSDGLLIRAVMQKDMFLDSLAAMSAIILGAARTATAQEEKGLPHRVIVETKHGRLIVVGAGPKALLIILANQDVGLGLILLELEKSAIKLKEIIT